MKKYDQKIIISKLVHEQYGSDDLMYEIAIRRFRLEPLVSTGLLQQHLGLSYSRARHVLDRLIESGFCLEQEGAKPCQINHYNN